jgi:hypothetical protein
MSTSTFLDGLQQLNLIASADEILQKAVSTRGEAIQIQEARLFKKESSFRCQVLKTSRNHGLLPFNPK